MRPSFRPPALPRADSDAPPSVDHYDQEFLYHLYRGSELLQDNAVDEAKAELERALALQPRDTEGQGLLGVVYFRLGMYPMAIEIFEQLEGSCPDEITPKINLALCYLKTGQAELARQRLEEVVKRADQHKRAWGYLGLVYQRLGEFGRAKRAFEKAGHPKLAERMALLISRVEADASHDGSELDGVSHSPAGASFGSLRPSLGTNLKVNIPPPPALASLTAGADEELSATTQAFSKGTEAAELGPVGVPALGRRVILPEPITRIAREAELIFPENPKVAMHPDGSVLARVDTSFAVRPQWLGGLSYHRAPFSTQPLRRRSANSVSNDPLGGAAPIVSLVGSGRLIITPHRDTRLLLFAVDRDALYLRENHVVGFQPQVSYESGRLDPNATTEMVMKLSGSGAVIAYSHGQLATLPVSAESPLCIRSGQVLGWIGRLLPRLIPPEEAPAGLTAMLGFSGHGSVLIDFG